jgi:DNA-binding transcriptional MerR regulator
MRSDQLADHAGLTYRQVDHWTRRGYLKPYREADGSGSQREFLISEAEVARWMARLDAAGFKLEAAATLARQIRDDGQTQILLGDGILLTVPFRG